MSSPRRIDADPEEAQARDAHRDKHFMQLALQQARLAYDKGEIPVGAVAVYRARVIACGHNSKESDRDPTAHAEMVVLRGAARFRAGWRLTGVTLYCTMEPCPMCAGAMVQARLPRLVFAVNDPKAGAAGSVVDLVQHPRLNHQIQVTRGLLAREAAALLDRFFRDLRSGNLKRYSQTWRARLLAENAKSV